MSRSEAARTVLVGGASSQLGVFLLPRLQRQGFRVMAFSRKAPASALVVSPSVSWIHPGQAASTPGDHLISCGPLDFAADLVERGLVSSRVVAFSSSSVVSKATSPDACERDIAARLAAMEERLQAACGQHGLPLLLLRPTLIYGCGLDQNVSAVARLARRVGIVPLAGRAGGLRQPVHADDLAALAVAALVAAEPLDRASAICGGSVLSYREMALRTIEAAAGRARLLPLPPAVLAAVARLAATMGLAPAFGPAMVERQNRNLVFDDTGLRKDCGWSPRPFEPSAADFSIPDDARRLQLPGHLL
jgi:nucleoside-diphosphate-sugar epimerase